MPETDVFIVGGGPVGLGLAIDLALRGVRVRVIERTVEQHRIPKGQNLTQRTGEHFRAWNVGDRVRRASPIPREFGNAGLVTYRHLLSEYSHDWFQRSQVGAYYFAENERLPQYFLEGVLRERLEELPLASFEAGCTAVGIDQRDHCVEIRFRRRNSSQSDAAAARYAVGCDGARSLVREWSGIRQATDHDGPRMALLVFRSTELDDLMSVHPGKSIFNVMNPDMNGYWQFLGRVDLNGGWFYHSPVPADATESNYDFRQHLHDMAGAKFALEFEHIGFWDLRISHAVSYRNKRVFVAGDAGHSHPPYGGYGINLGLEDARNLGWKLAAALEGWAGEGLLDSYTAERHPVFRSTSRDFIERMILDYRSFLTTYSPQRDRSSFERAWAARAAGEDREVTEFLPHYSGSPIVFGPPGATSGALGKHGFQARPGLHLAPQPLPDGRDLWEELGPGFTLMDLAGTGCRRTAWEGAARALGVPLKVLSLASSALRSAYGTEAILVRPDQFIAWSGGIASAEPSKVLSRASGHEAG